MFFLTPKLVGISPYRPEPSTHQAPTGADGHMGAAGLALQVASIEAVGPGGPLPGQALSSPVLHGDMPCQEARAAGQVQQEVGARRSHLVEKAGLCLGPCAPTLPPGGWG